jgi:hypothetical protein
LNQLNLIGIKNTIKRLKADIEKLSGLTGKTRKKGTAFLLKEKKDLLRYYENLLRDRCKEIGLEDARDESK